MRKISALNRLAMFVKFSLIAVLNTLLDAAIFFLICDIAEVNEIISNILSYSTATVNSYLINWGYVYGEIKYSLTKFLKFFTANVFVLIVSTLLVMFFSKFFESKIFAKVITLPLTMILNFTLQNFFVFAKAYKTEEREDSDNA